MLKYFWFFLFGLCLISSCDKEEDEIIPTRNYYMGFQNSAPSANPDLVFQSLNTWVQRADAAIISVEVPWKELLNGVTPSDYVNSNFTDLVTFYRSKNFKLWIYVDPQNGLDRTSDARALQAAGKSIADPDMQLLYQQFTVAMDSILKPNHLGLALETNLIRAVAPATIYAGVKQAANDVAARIHSRNPTVPLSVSVQADYAWGKLIGGSYTGIEQDFVDFPFITEVGISAYSYFGYKTPADIPLNYYSRLMNGRTLPVFIAEGGWPSISVDASDRLLTSSPELQSEYITRHGQLLDELNTIALFQLVFTDIDVSTLPSDIPPIIGLFANLGLVDVNLLPKPALSKWDDIFNNKKLVQ